jgi:hypothetical protein
MVEFHKPGTDEVMTMRKLRKRNLLVVIVLAVGLFAAAKYILQRTESPRPATELQTNIGSASPAAQFGVPVAMAAVTTSGKGKPVGRIDSCTLLSAKEIETIQGESLKDTKSSAQSSGGFGISQCFFTLPTFTNSISLVVTQRGDGPGARDPMDYWEEKFSEADSEAKETDRDKDRDKARVQGRSEEEEESARPLKISHVGDDAFWTGNAVGGALYVLKGNAFIRVSIGGSGEQRAQIKKAQALARVVLRHL